MTTYAADHAQRAAQPVTPAQPGPSQPREPEHPSGRLQWVSPHPGRSLLGAPLILLLVGTVTGLLVAVSARSTWAMLYVGQPAVLVVAAGYLLLARKPRLITLTGATLEVCDRGQLTRFDLSDPNLRLEASCDKTSFLSPDGRWVVIGDTDVEWAVFTKALIWYRELADGHASTTPTQAQ